MEEFNKKTKSSNKINVPFQSKLTSPTDPITNPKLNIRN